MASGRIDEAVALVKIVLRIWRQHDPGVPGRFLRYDLDDVSPDTTLLEALDAIRCGRSTFSHFDLPDGSVETMTRSYCSR